MRAAVVEDEVQVELRRRAGVDLTQKGEKLERPVASGDAAAIVAQEVLAAFRQGLRRRKARWALAGVLGVVRGLAVVAFAGFEEGLGRLAATSPFELGWDVCTQVYANTLEL
jgi:hypothetical protein